MSPFFICSRACIQDADSERWDLVTGTHSLQSRMPDAERGREGVKRTQCAPGKMLFGEVLRIPQLRSRRVTASAAEAANPPERWMHSNQGERRPQRTRRTARIPPVFECAPGELCSTLVRIHAAGVRLSLLGPTSGELGSIPGVGTPRGAVRRARLDPMQPVPDSGDWNPPRFSAGKRGKSQKQDSVIAPLCPGVNGFEGHPSKHVNLVSDKVSQNPKLGCRRGYFRHRPRVTILRTQRSATRFARALRRSRRALFRQSSWELRQRPVRGSVSGGRVRPCSSSMATSNSLIRSSRINPERPQRLPWCTSHNRRHSSTSGHADP